jgi:integrase
MVPLSAPARTLLERFLPGDPKRAIAERRSDGALTLPGLLGTPFAGWSKAKFALDKAVVDARAKAANSGWAPLVPWSVHDLRRTVATALQRLGVRLEVTEAVLNHISGSLAASPASASAMTGRPRNVPRWRHGPRTS